MHCKWVQEQTPVVFFFQLTKLLNSIIVVVLYVFLTKCKKLSCSIAQDKQETKPHYAAEAVVGVWSGK